MHNDIQGIAVRTIASCFGEYCHGYAYENEQSCRRQGSGLHNWHEVFASNHTEVLDFLRTRMEEVTSSRLSIRPGNQRLTKVQARHLILLLVVCKPDRDEGEVDRLRPNEVVYAIMAPDGIAEAVLCTRILTP